MQPRANLRDHLHGQKTPCPRGLVRPHAVGEAVEKRARPQERLRPQEAEALGDLGPERRSVELAFLLERSSHRKQGKGRAGVGDRVEEEGKRPAESEEHAAERWTADLDHRLSRDLGAHRVGQLARRHDGA